MSSTVKAIAYQVLEAIDKMARPEMQNIVMEKIWNYIKNYTARIILKKPDIELQTKLKEIHTILNPIFKTVDKGIDYREGVKLGSPKIAKTASTKEMLEMFENL